MNIINWNRINDREREKYLTRPISNNLEIGQQVSDIINSVKQFGDAALEELTKKYDDVDLADFLVSKKEIDNAFAQVSNEDLDHIKLAIQRIEHYQYTCIPKEYIVNTKDGVFCQKILRPIERVGLYVPGGTAPLVSTVMMLAIPAKIAQCPMRIMCTPPNKHGLIEPILLVTAALCGTEVIYKIGGAQAVAAMAYGTTTIPKVDKIYGPGNSWVSLAKLKVAEDPYGASIDLPAGPSEVLVIAEESANPNFVAADLLSQAEHGKDSQVIFITNSKSLISNVQKCISEQIDLLPRKDIIEESLKNSAMILVSSLREAFDISNAYAPEHLILQLENPDSYLNLIKKAGAVFLGAWTPESMGDYITGANHVLPTNGYASTWSGLSVSDYMNYISVQKATRSGFKFLSKTAMRLASIEQLDAHKNAILTRLDDLE